MATPNATILLSINGAAFVQTSAATPQGQTAPSGATIQLKGQDITNWQQASWEIFCFPPNWAGPAGADWTYDSVRNLYVSHQFQPSLITLPAASSLWGKWIARLVVNNGIGPGSNGLTYSDVGQLLPSTMVDTSGGWQTVSAALGLQDVGLYEGTQFGGYRVWVAALQTMLRSVETSLSAALGNITWQSGTDANYQIQGSQGPQYVVLPAAFTAPHTYKTPTTPADGMAVTLYDLSGLLVDTGNTLSITAPNGTDHFFFDGVDRGTTWQIPAAIFKYGSVTLTRRVATNSWNVA